MSRLHSLWQAVLRRRAGVGLLACLMLCLTLAACGKKAGRVDPPPDVVDDQFPLTYPDPATDPPPSPSP
jgi:hypothetical protein